jgi:predicted nuclease of restriction endonuclease-like (RecB) superfamily
MSNMSQSLVQYTDLLALIKQRIRQGQTRAVFAANAEMILTYWDIGRMIREKQEREGWGASVIPRLSRDIRNELPEVKGFSERTIGRMIAFYRAYPALGNFLPRPVAKIHLTINETVTKVPQAGAKLPVRDALENLQRLVAKIPWGHNILLMEKIKGLKERAWYMQQKLEHGWSRPIFFHMIEGRAYDRQYSSLSVDQETFVGGENRAGTRPAPTING